MMIFYEDTETERSIPAMIASYSASLLEAGKSKCMACSIISPIRALSCNPSLVSVRYEAPSLDRRSVRDDHQDIRGHAMGMCLGS